MPPIAPKRSNSFYAQIRIHDMPDGIHFMTDEIGLLMESITYAGDSVIK